MILPLTNQMIIIKIYWHALHHKKGDVALRGTEINRIEEVADSDLTHPPP